MNENTNVLSESSEDCIAALASAYGVSAVAVIRVSGKNSHEILKSCLGWDKNYKPQANYLYLRNFINPINTQVIDQILVSFFYAPRSFTGQDSIEIYCHGGVYIIKNILSTLYSLGIREAKPGEFTFRAYLNGKIDLSQAEGINQLINAVSEEQWIAATQLFTGQLTELIQNLKSQLIDILSYLNAKVDFPEEEDVQNNITNINTHVQNTLYNILNTIETLLNTYDTGKIAKDGLKVAIIGPTNVGKSTLMNTLLGEPRVIVSPIAGTTRDYIEESILLKGRLIKLIDTAGIRISSDPIEQEGIELTKQICNKADLILFVVSKDVAINNEIYNHIKHDIIKTKDCICILNKKDLIPNYHDITAKNHDVFNYDICISCYTLEGIETLKQKIIDYFDNKLRYLKHEGQIVISSLRHKQALMAAKDYIMNALALLNNEHVYEELLAFEVTQCANALKSIIGEISNAQILDKIFSEFCIGK